MKTEQEIRDKIDQITSSIRAFNENKDWPLVKELSLMGKQQVGVLKWVLDEEEK